MTETAEAAAEQSPDLPEAPEADVTEPQVPEAGGAEPDSAATERGSAAGPDLEHEGEVAADYLEELLDITDLDGDIDMDVEGQRAMVSLVGGDLEHLVGSDGEVLDAIQELTRLAVLRETGQRSRLMLDIAGWRAAKRTALTERGTKACDQVKSTGESLTFEPMTPFERKIVHDAVAAAGCRSESTGEEPNRCVVVLLA